MEMLDICSGTIVNVQTAASQVCSSAAGDVMCLFGCFLILIVIIYPSCYCEVEFLPLCAPNASIDFFLFPSNNLFCFIIIKLSGF